MVEDRPDWCISRQRSWGVPIPVFKCAKCGSTVANEQTFDAVIELFRTEGADSWFIKQPSDYLPAGIACETCGCTELVPEKDILDVWWESGVTHTSVCKHRASEGLRFPADMYLEGSDQHRGWFQSSLLTSVGAYGVAPYKSVMHCGFTVDENGEKMSKSKGNGVDPADVMEKFGADVLRLWVSSVDYSQDVRISDDILKQVSDAYRRIRNTFRFLLGSLDDFDDSTMAVTDFEALEPIDRYYLAKTLVFAENVKQAYNEYRFHNVYREAYNFTNELSSVYLDLLKDRLYSEAKDSPRRRAAQTVCMNILEVLVRVLAPVLSFTTDEAWEHYPPAIRNREGRVNRVQLAGWPQAADFVPAITLEQAHGIIEAFEPLMAAREVVTKALEEARAAKAINKSQEACITLTMPADELLSVNELTSAMLEELFIVSEVQVVEGEELSAVVSRASGEKCPRCWNYRELQTEGAQAGVCARCADVLDGMGFIAEA